MTNLAKRALCASCLLLAGCHSSSSPSGPHSSRLTPPEIAHAANAAFLHQTSYNPWLLSAVPGVGPAVTIPAYLSNGKQGYRIHLNDTGGQITTFRAGRYVNGFLKPAQRQTINFSAAPADRETLDFQTGQLSINTPQGSPVWSMFVPGGHNWPEIWKTSDIQIDGDPQAQQVTHANLFYLLSSTYRGSTHSLPPMGLSSNGYSGHIFWDADVWMLPALIVQHPQYAKSIVAYRFQRLAEAQTIAKTHGHPGAEFPWESAGSGQERAPGGFSSERHITADVAWGAWQYYLWTGDLTYLKTMGWPLLKQTAAYWVSRVTKGKDGQYHISHVISPDETAGTVSDDAYTNADVQANLEAAVSAAHLLGQRPDPRWAEIAKNIYLPFDKKLGFLAENDSPLTPRFAAKQADTLLLLYPLNLPCPAATETKMLNYYAAHTIPTGPAMTSSIEAVVAARLGLGQQSLADFQASYQPFERAPWDAFAEKRTKNNVYFMTGMAGCLQSILYGFAGLHIYLGGQTPEGTRLAGDTVASLYAEPHLPPGWGKLTIDGIHFRGKSFDLTIKQGNKVIMTPVVFAALPERAAP